MLLFLFVGISCSHRYPLLLRADVGFQDSVRVFLFLKIEIIIKGVKGERVQVFKLYHFNLLQVFRSFSLISLTI